MKGQDRPSDYSDEQIKNIYMQIGSLHNKGLDYCLAGLRREFGEFYTGGRTEDERQRILKKLQELSLDFTSMQLQVDVKFVSSWLKRLADLNYRDEDGISGTLRNSQTGLKISPLFYEALNKIEMLLSSDESMNNKVLFDQIVNDYIGRLTSFEEKSQLVASVSTAWWSSAYWHERGEEWASFFAGHSVSSELTQARRFPWNQVASADVSGVVTGGSAGCAWGAVGGTVFVPGAGTVAGCAGVGAVMALGGGLGGSVKKTVEEFFNWLF